jgi:pyruvate formate lyase activating enzyme
MVVFVSFSLEKGTKTYKRNRLLGVCGAAPGNIALVKIALRKTSLVDYPGKVAAVFFFFGCNLRCPWCHNRELVLGGGNADPVSLEEGMAHITKRRSLLGGVVLSGGEPTLYGELPELIRKIKSVGLAVKLDTNGMNPLMLETLFQQEETRPDYVAMDLKLAPSRYGELLPPSSGTAAEAEKALKESAALVCSSGIAHEFRSLALPAGFFGPADIEALSPLAGGSLWHIRPFKPGNCLESAWDAYPPGDAYPAASLCTEKGGPRAL